MENELKTCHFLQDSVYVQSPRAFISKNFTKVTRAYRSHGVT